MVIKLIIYITEKWHCNHVCNHGQEIWYIYVTNKRDRGILHYTIRAVSFCSARNTWQVIFNYHDKLGKKRWKKHSLNATTHDQAVKEAHKYHLQIESCYNEKTYQLTQTTFQEYFYKYINELEEMESVEPSTLAGYRNDGKRALPYLGDFLLPKITSQDIITCERSLLKKGYSSSSVIKTHRLLRQMFSAAVSSSMIKKDPSSGVKPPKLKSPMPNAMSIAQTREVFSLLDLGGLSNLKVAAYLALYTGMRRGEVCALRWSNIDFKKEELWVKESIGVVGKDIYVKKPKNDKCRLIPIPSPLLEILKVWKNYQKEKFLDLNESFTENGYVLCEPQSHGLPYYHPDNLTREWKQFSTMFNIVGSENRRIVFHDLRHTYATLAIREAGIDVKTVSSILGHADAAMTLNIYASTDGNAKHSAAEKLSKLF